MKQGAGQNKKTSPLNKKVPRRITIAISEELYEKFRIYCFKKKTNLTQEVKKMIELVTSNEQ